jgi:hypothetical protein
MASSGGKRTGLLGRRRQRCAEKAHAKFEAKRGWERSDEAGRPPPDTRGAGGQSNPPTNGPLGVRVLRRLPLPRPEPSRRRTSLEAVVSVKRTRRPRGTSGERRVANRSHARFLPQCDRQEKRRRRRRSRRDAGRLGHETLSCPNQVYILALIARHLRAQTGAKNIAICRRFRVGSSIRSICLKIVVSPVRVRVSPLVNLAWLLGFLLSGVRCEPRPLGTRSGTGTQSHVPAEA